MSAVTVDLDHELLALLGDSPDALRETVREPIVRELHRRFAISGGRASHLLGLDRLALMRLASVRGIPVIDMTAEEWREEVRRVRSL